MSITKINNFFSDSELIDIKKIIKQRINFNDKYKNYNEHDESTYLADYNKPNTHKGLSRLQATIKLPIKTHKKLIKNYSDLLGFKVKISHVLYVRYSGLYGSPNLPPHIDADETDLIIDYQLDSNTSWDLGLNLKTYCLENNSALVFNPNKDVHWRPHKSFNDGEYVDMIFIRFVNLKDVSNQKYLKYYENDDTLKKVKKEIREVRDNLKTSIF